MGHRKSEDEDEDALGRDVEACVDSELGEGAEVLQPTPPLGLLTSRWRMLLEAQVEQVFKHLNTILDQSLR